MTCLGNQATVLAELGYLHKANLCLAEQTALAQALNRPRERAHALLSQAHLAISANRFEDALTLAGQALEIAEEHGLRPLLEQVERVIGGIAYHPARPGPGLDLNAPNTLDWFAADERAMRAVLGAVNAVNLRDRHQRTPLMGAVYHGFFKLIQDLLKRKAGVNLRDRENDTALMIARRRHPDQRQVAEILSGVGAR